MSHHQLGCPCAYVKQVRLGTLTPGRPRYISIRFDIDAHERAVSNMEWNGCCRCDNRTDGVDRSQDTATALSW
jgi:hypothetical protein